jgi:hypothetical protein
MECRRLTENGFSPAQAAEFQPVRLGAGFRIAHPQREGRCSWAEGTDHVTPRPKEVAQANSRIEQEKPPIAPLRGGFRKEQVASPPILPQGLEGVSGMAPPVSMRRLLR